MDIDRLVSHLRGKFRKAELAENIKDPTDFVSTGNLAFDLISDGGMPFGYLAEFLGLSQSGKSSFIYQIIANAQTKFNAFGILVDRENAFTQERGQQLGIDNSRLLLAKPVDVPTVYDAFTFIIDSIEEIRKQEAKEKEKTYIVIGVDSISSFSKDVSLEKADPGRKAKAVHESLREVLTDIDDRTMLLVANQVTYRIGVLFGDPKTTTAGESMKYYSTLRFALEDRKKIIDESRGGEVIGNWLGVEVIKTRRGPCYRTCYIPFSYKNGIPWYGGYARLLAQRGYLKPKNATEFKTFKQRTLLYGEESLNESKIEAFLQQHPELLFKEYPEFFGAVEKEDVDE